MASEADRTPPAEDTAVVNLEDQPAQSEDDWPVSDLYLIEPAEDDPPPDDLADAPEGITPVGSETVMGPDAAPAAPLAPSRRRFPPDVGPGLLLAIGGTVAVIILVALLLGLRQDDPANARLSRSQATTSEHAQTTPAPASGQIGLRDLQGMTVTEARSLLEKQGLRVQVSRLQSGRPRGEVLAQQPPAGTQVAKGDALTLVVSSGKSSPPTSTGVRVPGVVGLSATDAARELRNAGLRPRIRPVTSSEGAGTVIEQLPTDDASVAQGSVVRLDVAKARPRPVRVDVPDVVGSSASAARRELRSAGLTVTFVSVDSPEPAGTVVSQSPRAGAELRKGSEVTLRVSTGPADADVPEVTGLDENSATAQLESAGFQVRVTDESTTDPSQDGLVIHQAPQAGSIAAKGALVIITVARLG
jgi:eukaryotic-like serine/threonine-protein kinase